MTPDEKPDPFTDGYRRGYVAGYEAGTSDGRFQGYAEAKYRAFAAMKDDFAAQESLRATLGEE